MVSIIIINYNTFDVTSNCIQSILDQQIGINYEIIIVDNASTERNLDLFIENFPLIKLIKSKENLGFAGGNNLGLVQAAGEYILLLNSDTILIEDCISPCIQTLVQNDQIGVVSPKLLNPDLSYQKNARRFKSIKLELLDLIRPLVKLTPYQFYSRLFLNQYFNGDYDTECDWLCGAFFMFRRDVLSKMLDNKLDDRFFMYGEDALWCYQLKQLGYFIQFLSQPKLIHIGGSSDFNYIAKEKQKFLIKREVELYQIQSKSRFNAFIFEHLLKIKKFILQNL